MVESIPASYLWLIAGAVMLCIEAFGVPGIGFLFAGIGAFAAGIAVEMGWIGQTAFIAQFACWFATTTLSAALLWKYLKRWRSKNPSEQYHNFIGTTATVIEPLFPGRSGKVRWSGAVMLAELDSTTSESVAEGVTVEVVSTRGTTLIVKPRLIA